MSLLDCTSCMFITEDTPPEDAARMRRISICTERDKLHTAQNRKERWWPCEHELAAQGAPKTSELLRQAFALLDQAYEMHVIEMPHEHTIKCSTDSDEQDVIDGKD